ncbi:M56 family metallopeptidase [Winogradskyella sp. A2]|uniref:M56 family metallopeptidase n=1 Tax=Winogradskyella sp. A2 TaxID=3366944 RepID=UPI00398C7AD3
MEYLLKATIVLAVFYVCYFFFLRKETFFNHNRWYLLGGLLISLLLPLIIIPIHVTVEPQTVSQQLYTFSENAPLLNKVQKESFNWMNLLLGVYAIGLVIFLVHFMFQFGSLIWLLLTNPKNKDGIYTYVIVNNKISPFSFFKWIVYNPKSFNQTELQLMLTHEKVHANQLHSIDILFAQLACSIFWFNPIVWLYRRDVRQNLEYIADFETHLESANTKEYQHLLLKTSIADQQISLSNNFYNSLIKERIVMLQKSRSNGKKQWRYFLILPILAGLLMSMNTETIYIESEDYMTLKPIESEKTEGKQIEIVFNKDTTEEQLEVIKKELKSNGITMTINRIKRNDNNEIIDIDIDFKTENGSANYTISSDEGIKPFKFNMSDDGSFSVGAVNEKEVIMVEDVIFENRSGDDEANVFFFKEGDEDEIIEIEEDSGKVYKIRVKAGNEFHFDGKHKVKGLHKDHDVDTDVHVIKEYIIDSTNSKKEFIIKTDNYFEGDKKIKIKKGDKDKISTPGGKGSNRVSVFASGNNSKPLIIIGDEIVSDIELQAIDPDNIANINVLKGDSATEIYGSKGKDGVVVVRLKDNNYKFLTKTNSWESKKIKANRIEYKDHDTIWIEKSKNNQKSPWKVTTGVSGYTFISDDDISKNATLGIISKNTPKSVLDANKSKLEDLGVTVKYSKIKRNKAGEITGIKITLKNDKGNQSSASYKDNDGISEIEYGVIGDNLVVRSRN